MNSIKDELLARFRAEDGKHFWINQDGSWIFPAVRGGAGEDDDDGSGGKDDDKPTLTQKQLDEIVKNRVGKAKESAVKDLLKNLGVEDPEALKTLLANAKAAEDKGKTDLEKAQGDLAKEKNTAATLKADFDAFKKSTAIKDELIEQGLKPSQAALVVDMVKVEDADPEKIKAAIEDLKKVMPQVFVAGDGKAPIQGGNPGTPPPGGNGDGNDPQAIAKRRLYERHPGLKK